MGWNTNRSRRKPHKLTLFYKMKNGLCLDYLTSLVVSDTAGSASTYHLRNSVVLPTTYTDSRLYYTSFLPSVVCDWNKLQEQTRNSPTLNIFKNRLNSNLSTPRGYYNTGKRFGQIYEPQHEISSNVVCATSKVSNQPANTRSLIRAFASCLNIL